MDAPVLSSDEARELAMLRQRAYGPASDIRADEVVRLQVLEDALHPASAVTETVADRWAPAEPDAAEESTPAAEPLGAGTADEPEADVAPTEEPGTAVGSRFDRRRWWVVASVVATLLIVGAVWGTGQLLSTRPDATLSLVPTEPEIIDRARVSGVLPSLEVDAESIEQYEPYGPFTLWSATSATGQQCLIVTNREEAQGWAGGSCTPRGLDPISDVTIWPGMPPSLSGGLPAGTVIRFQLRAGTVDVWQREPDPDL
jgi:hypothetical protein